MMEAACFRHATATRLGLAGIGTVAPDDDHEVTDALFQRVRAALTGVEAMWDVETSVYSFDNATALRDALPELVEGGTSSSPSAVLWQLGASCGTEIHEGHAAMDFLRRFGQAPISPGPCCALAERRPNVPHGFDFDLVVVGAGSGGLAAAKEAADLGASVCCVNYVSPTQHGTQWGIGGTCLNVGCVPKKLMHAAALAGETLDGAFGHDTAGRSHNWGRMVESIQALIVSMNDAYESELLGKAVTYYNAFGQFQGAHTLCLSVPDGEEAQGSFPSAVTGAHFLIAAGGRPRPLPCSGAECAISSDDIFSMKSHPGKVLCIGAGYVSLECAGFLRGLGCDVAVLVRSRPLRQMDRDSVHVLVEDMARRGIRMLYEAVPKRIVKTAAGTLRVTYTGGTDDTEEEFDTVLKATGRAPLTSDLRLDRAGAEVCADGKVRVNAKDQSPSADHVYAVGGVAHGVLELHPIAREAGRLVARRLFGESSETMDYQTVPTTIFTPLEYGSIGLSEEAARDKLGSGNVDAYVSRYVPLEWMLVEEKQDRHILAKVVVNLRDSQRVIGVHFVGPNAGEVVQGFAVAMRKGATYRDFFSTVSVHPTVAEGLTNAEVTRSSGRATEKTGCCS